MVGLNMTLNIKSGNRELSFLFPSSNFSYAYFPDYSSATYIACPLTVGRSFKSSYQVLSRDQNVSIVQVPFNAKYEVNNYNQQLPFPKVDKRGNISLRHYPSLYNIFSAKLDTPCAFPLSPTLLKDVELFMTSVFISPMNMAQPRLKSTQNSISPTEVVGRTWASSIKHEHITSLICLLKVGVVESTIVVTPNF